MLRIFYKNTREKGKNKERKESRMPMSKNQLNGTLSKFCEKLYRLKIIHVTDYTAHALTAAFYEYLAITDKEAGENRASAFLEDEKQIVAAIKYMQSYGASSGRITFNL